MLSAIPDHTNAGKIRLQSKRKGKGYTSSGQKNTGQRHSRKEMRTEWEYARVICQLNFLEKSTRPKKAYAVHQFVSFTGSPKESHKQAMLRIGRYLMAKREAGIIL